MNYKSIRHWPEDERPRERLLQSGAGGLSTAQLLAIILRTGGQGKSAVGLARELLLNFSSLKEIEDASVAEFQGIKGIGSAKVAEVKAAFELGRRLMSESAGSGDSNPAFRSSREVFDYYRGRFYGLKKEKFFCVMLDTKNRVFKETIVSEGTLNASLVHPREVFRYAIKEAAAAVLFIHNHPSGDPDPSPDDINITKRLVEAGRIVGIDVLDHIIVADGAYVSLMEKGLVR
ncbi:DNA repair protein RadC [bacterium]|nr:DNA repair protein RadC [bacterium]